jgi:hypothetical protein
MAAMEGERTPEGLPAGMNVLTQEAQMQNVENVAPIGDMTTGADMDVNTPDGMSALGQWNEPPAQ